MPDILPIWRLDGFVREFARRRKYTLAPLPGGMLDQTLRLVIWPQAFVLKVFRPTVHEQQIEHMHELMQFVSRSGLPVSRPIVTALIGERVCAIYSFLPGTCMSRYRASIKQAHAVGAVFGRIHVALDRFSATDCAAAWPPPASTSCSRPNFAGQLSNIRGKLKEHDAVVRREMTPIVDFYERTLSSGIWDAPVKYANEFCHGDFHGGNVLVEGDFATGVLDWDKAGWYSRAAEVGRALVTMCRYSPTELAWSRVEGFLQGYLHHHPRLSGGEASTIVNACLTHYACGLWPVHQYLAGQKQYRRAIIRRLALARSMLPTVERDARRIADMCDGRLVYGRPPRSPSHQKAVTVDRGES